MEDTLQPLDENDQPIPLNKPLLFGLAASLVLHVACTVILIGLPGGGSPPRQSITYVDLAHVPPTPAMAPPASEPAPVEESAPPETPPVPEAPPTPQPPQAAAQPEAPPQQQSAAPMEELSHTTLGLGLTKGYFKSLGDGETLRVDIKEYYLELLQRINEKWWMDQFDQQRVDPIVISITVARNGSIVGSTIIGSSGNPRYDRAVQRSLVAAGPLPPLPPEYEGEFFQAPIRLVPPLNLTLPFPGR